MQRVIQFLTALFILQFLTLCPANAQENAWRFDLAVGGHFLDYFQEDRELTDYQTAFSYGLQGRFVFPITERLQARAGLGFERLGVKQRDYSIVFGSDLDPITGAPDFKRSFFENTFEATYVLLPVDFTYAFSEAHAGTFVSMGFGLMAEVSSKQSSNTIENGMQGLVLTTETTQYGLNRFLLPVTFGLGYAWPLGDGKVILTEASYRRIMGEPATTTTFISGGQLEEIGGKPFQSFGLMLGLRF